MRNFSDGEQKKDINTGLDWGIRGDTVPITKDTEVNLNDFGDNFQLSAQENYEIKRAVVDTTMYIFGFEADYNNVLSVIDAESSKKWFAQDWYYEGGWTIADEIHHLKNSNRDNKTLDSIETNFMIRLRVTKDNFLQVSVPVYLLYMNGEAVGYRLYDFFFERIDGQYKIIGIAVG
jgi:hypothetical protein